MKKLLVIAALALGACKPGAPLAPCEEELVATVDPVAQALEQKCQDRMNLPRVLAGDALEELRDAVWARRLESSTFTRDELDDQISLSHEVARISDALDEVRRLSCREGFEALVYVYSHMLTLARDIECQQDECALLPFFQKALENAGS